MCMFLLGLDLMHVYNLYNQMASAVDVVFGVHKRLSLPAEKKEKIYPNSW